MVRATQKPTPTSQDGASDTPPPDYEFSAFFSYKQEPKSKVIREFLKANLFPWVEETFQRPVWLDIDRDNIALGDMQRGVEHCKFFIMVMSEAYFQSGFCLSEVQWAVGAGKELIILCDESDRTSLGKMFGIANAASKGLGDILGRVKVIDVYTHEVTLRRATVERIQRQIRAEPEPQDASSSASGSSSSSSSS